MMTMSVGNSNARRSVRKSGRPATITLKVVKRVGKKVAQGVPLRYALASENNCEINVDSWHKAIQRNEDFRAEYERASAVFVEAACKRLVADRSPANLRWILERRYPMDFARRPDAEINVTQTVGGPSPRQIMTLEIARAIALPGEQVESIEDCSSLEIEAARAVCADLDGRKKIEALQVSAETRAYLLQARQSAHERYRQLDEDQERLDKRPCPLQ